MKLLRRSEKWCQSDSCLPTIRGLILFMDIYISKAIIHQFSPDDTELCLMISQYHLKSRNTYVKIERVYSDEAKTGIFGKGEKSPSFNHIRADLLSIATLQSLKEEFSASENLKTNDWFFVQFSKEGVEHFCFLSAIALRETFDHLWWRSWATQSS